MSLFLITFNLNTIFCESEKDDTNNNKNALMINGKESKYKVNEYGYFTNENEEIIPFISHLKYKSFYKPSPLKIFDNIKEISEYGRMLPAYEKNETINEIPEIYKWINNYYSNPEKNTYKDIDDIINDNQNYNKYLKETFKNFKYNKNYNENKSFKFNTNFNKENTNKVLNLKDININNIDKNEPDKNEFMFNNAVKSSPDSFLENTKQKLILKPDGFYIGAPVAIKTTGENYFFDKTDHRLLLNNCIS